MIRFQLTLVFVFYALNLEKDLNLEGDAGVWRTAESYARTENLFRYVGLHDNYICKGLG